MQNTETPFHARHEAELLTLEEVADILQTPVNTVRWWRQIGTGPDFFKIGRRLFTTVGEVRRFIRDQRLQAKPMIAAARKAV